jgi:hypothetical protein
VKGRTEHALVELEGALQTAAQEGNMMNALEGDAACAACSTSVQQAHRTTDRTTDHNEASHLTRP